MEETEQIHNTEEINTEIERLEGLLHKDSGRKVFPTEEFNSVLRGKIRALYWVIKEDIKGRYSWSLND